MDGCLGRGGEQNTPLRLPMGEQTRLSIGYTAKTPSPSAERWWTIYEKRRVNELEGVNPHIRQRRRYGDHPPGRRSASVFIFILCFVAHFPPVLYFLVLWVPGSREGKGYWDRV